MERYRCDPQVIKACKIKKLYGCDGYYLGAGCRCAKDNQSIMAETEYQELQAYRATGLTVERAAELGKADQEGRVVVLPCKVGDKIYLRGKADKRTRSGARIVEQAISYIAIYDDWIDIDGICEAEELGEYAFLTREEAEKVLEAEE